ISYLIYKNKLEKDYNSKEKEKEKENSEKMEEKLKNVISVVKGINIENWNLLCRFNYCRCAARVIKLANKVRESRNLDLADYLLASAEYLSKGGCGIYTAIKIVKSLEVDHRIDESAYLRKADSKFNLSIIACVFLILSVPFCLLLTRNAMINQPEVYSLLPSPASIFYVTAGALAGLFGSIVGWAGRSPQAYDMSSGKRRIDIQWALLSAISYPFIPSIIGAVTAIAIVTGVFPLKSDENIFGYITIICFAIGFSDSFRTSIMKKLSNSK
ncbi:hypothetical protein, partial [Komagataeibacter swingsii]